MSTSWTKSPKLITSQDNKVSNPGWGNQFEILEKVAKRGEGHWCWRTGGEDSGETSLGQLDKKSRVGSVQDDRKSNPRHEEIQ